MKIFKKIIFVLIQIIICLSILEAGSYLFLKNTGNPAFRAKRILQTDNQLGWKLQSNLNTQFENSKLVTDERGFRPLASTENTENWILTVGPSSAFGWGVESEQTYTALVSQNTKAAALNASQIGYSIVQGQRLLERVLIAAPTTPRYLIISYGINDLDKFRFYTDNYLPDSAYFSQIIRFPFIFSAAPYSNFLNLLTLINDEAFLKFNCQSLSSIQQRVSIEDYMKYLDEMVQLAERSGITPIIINTPYYLKTKNPDYTSEKIKELYSATQKAAAQGNCSEALNLLAEAKKLEPDRVAQDVLKLNVQLEFYAHKHDLLFIDTHSLLNTDEISLNYVDPIHPSVRGHQLIAEKIYPKLIF